MNMKKFISLASAVAMVSSLTVVPVSVHAEGETVLWSDTFNTYAIPEETYGDWLTGVLIEGVNNAGGVYDGIPGIGLQVGTRNGGDDSTYWTLNGKADNAEDKYLVTATGRFATGSKGGKLIFGEPQSATDENDIVVAFDVAGINCRDANVTYDRAFSVYGEDGNTLIDLDTADLGGVEWDSRNNITADNWSTLKVVVSTSGTKVFLGDTEVATSSATTITGLDFSVYINGAAAANGSEYRIDGAGHGYPAYAFDNVIMYSTAAGAGEASTIPEIQGNTSTPQPTNTPAPVAEITDTTTIDFDENTLDKAGVTTTSHKDYTTITEEPGGNSTTNAMKIAQTSEKDNSYAYATLDFSSVTDGKSHIIVDYDLYTDGDGRIKVILQDGPVSGSKATELSSGLISQGITSSSSTPAFVKSEWFHTTVDVNLVDGLGTYVVTKSSDGSEVISGKIDTDLTAVNTMSFVSWSPNTTYLDNLQIQTGGTMEGPVLATPEPASEADGSADLMPTDAVYIGDMSAATSGEDAPMLNHELSQKLISANDIPAYSDKARGKSIYAAYDVYVAPGASTSIIATGDSGNAVSSTMKLTTNKDNTITVSADTDKGTVTAEQKLVADTWYRVLVEVPQSGTAEATSTDPLTFTIYRINAEDSKEVTEVAAQLTGLSSRGLVTRGATAFNVTADGDVYVDNASVYIYTTGFSYLAAPVTETTPEPASTEEGSYIALAPDDARATFDASAIQSDSIIKILNHTDAKPAVANSVDTYSDKAKGYSIFAAYDVYVDAGDKLTLAAYGDGGKALGTQFVLTGNTDGTATATALVDKGDTVNVGTVVNKTWYRVVIEVPQTSEGTTGNATYTIYRINPENPEETLEVAAQKDGLTPRNLSGRGMTSLVTTVEGTPYIDNVAVYLAKTNVSLKDVWTKYEVEYDANGRVTTVTSEPVADPSTVDTTGNTATSKTFVWNGLQQPYTAE